MREVDVDVDVCTFSVDAPDLTTRGWPAVIRSGPAEESANSNINIHFMHASVVVIAEPAAIMPCYAWL